MTDPHLSVICPACHAKVPVTVTISAITVAVDGKPSLIVVASPVFTHACGGKDG